MRISFSKARAGDWFLRSALTMLLLTLAGDPYAKAGPPYTTDDPEPTDLHHWEIFFAITADRDSGGWDGAAPQLEIDYGLLPNTQISLIAPLAFSSPRGEANQAGLGDMQLSVKYRFLEESDWLPQIAVFPQINPPTGDRSRNLGAGETTAYFPLWLQKDFGKWTVTGGGGYWINPGAGNRNWWYSGLLLQRKISTRLTVGAEVFHETSSGIGIPSNTSFNIGAVLELSDRWDVVFSAGRSIVGPTDFQEYFAFRLKLGPEKEK